MLAKEVESVAILLNYSLLRFFIIHAYFILWRYSRGAGEAGMDYAPGKGTQGTPVQYKPVKKSQIILSSYLTLRVPYQLNLKMSQNVTKPGEPSSDEVC